MPGRKRDSITEQELRKKKRKKNKRCQQPTTNSQKSKCILVFNKRSKI